MKKILMLIAGVMLTTGMMQAVPAKRGWLTMDQPDGTQIEVQLMGDEYYHYAINRDGKRVKQNAEGWWIEAGEVPSAEVAQARRVAAMIRKNVRRSPQAVGVTPNLAPKGVVILANFNDSQMKAAHTQAVFDELCNSTNCTVNQYNNKNYGSAAQYFADQSNGSYRPQFDVFGPVTLSRNVAYYGTDNDTGNPAKDEGDDQHATDAVVEACILANQQYSNLNFADYDSDGDGYVDFVYVIYAGKGQADGGTATTIWPHNWEVESAIYYGYCTYTKAQCQIDGKKLNNYAMSGELSGSSLSGIGTLCHEFGHVMGLPDLYDTKYGDNYQNGVTPGDWNIMDGGSYNGDGHCPPNYDPWQKYFFGWVTPVNLGTEGKDITLQANGTTGYQSYQINSVNTLQTATTAGVNYYIENRQKQGWDAFVPTSGMLVWKINFNVTAWNNNEPNNTSGSPKYTIVPADGKTKNYGASGDTYPTNSVRSYTPIIGHALTEITKSGSNITFKYNGGKQKTECTYELVGEHCVVPEDGVVAYDAALSLTITPEAGYTLADPSCWTVEMANELVYGEGFTYNASTSEFRIEHVTDDVVIMAEGKAQVTLTWMANGVQFAQTITAGSVVLPENEPEACDGKVFVGWTTTADYEDASVAPTFVKTGDTASQQTFYAVYATEEESEKETIEKANSIAVGDQVILVNETAKKELSGIGGSNPKYGEGANYTSTPAGAYLLDVEAGSTSGTYALKHGSDYLQWASGNSLSTKTSKDANSSWNITFSSGNTIITNAAENERSLQWNSGNPRFACYTSAQKAVQLYKKTSGGASYSDYTTSCTDTPQEPVYYTIRFFVNGEKVSDNEVLKGSIAEQPKDPSACDGYSFAGWWTAELASDNTEAKSWIGNFKATKDQDYYAVFSKTEETAGGGDFDGNTAGTYKIYALVGNTKYYATTLDNGKLLSTTDATEAVSFTLEKVSNGFAIKSGDTYIKYNGSGTNLGTQATAYTWSITTGSAGSWRVNSQTDSRAMAFSDSAEKFGGYSTSNIGKTVQGTTYYDIEIGGSGNSSTTYYSTTMDCQGQGTGVEQQLNEPIARKIIRNGQMIIIRGEQEYNVQGTRVQ